MQVRREHLDKTVLRVILVTMGLLVTQVTQVHKEWREEQETFVSTAAESFFCYTALTL